jgi:hypothetical protein
MHDAAIRRLTLGCLLAGFAGPEVPGWLARALADGRAASCCSAPISGTVPGSPA